MFLHVLADALGSLVVILSRRLLALRLGVQELLLGALDARAGSQWCQDSWLQCKICRGLWMPELVLRLLAKQLLETVHDLSSLESSCCRQRPLTPPPGESRNDNGNITPIFVEFHICRDFDNVKMLYCCIVLYNIIKTDPLLSFFQPKQQIILKDLRY